MQNSQGTKTPKKSQEKEASCLDRGSAQRVPGAPIPLDREDLSLGVPVLSCRHGQKKKEPQAANRKNVGFSINYRTRLVRFEAQKKPWQTQSCWTGAQETSR